MIKKISFENILTFDQKQVLEFNLKEQLNVIYGKNSAGKSNFLAVLRILQQSIISGLENMDSMVCKFSHSSLIFIEVLLEIKDEEYNYGFEYCTSEKIYINEILNIGGKLVFENNNSIITSELMTNDQVLILNNYDFKKNGVMKYITELNSDDKLIKKVHDMKKYFQLDINSSDEYKYLLKNETLLKNVITQMKNIDVDIDDIIIRDNTSSMLDFKKEMNDKLPEEVIEDFVAKNNYKVYFVHNGIDIALEMESSGTQKYFALVVGALTGTAKYGEYIHIFDEIETHFHNELMKKFFNFFKTEIKGQLICTTHNQTILDEKLIGKENILFVDKKENSSEIYRLSSFDGIRSDKRHNWKKLYNEDRFGAYPNIKN